MPSKKAWLKWLQMSNYPLNLHHSCFSLFLIYFLIGGKLLYDVVLVSAIQQYKSAIITHTSPPSWASLPPPPLQVITERQAWLPVLHSNTSSAQFSSVAQSCLMLCDPMNRSTPGLPVHHQLPEFTQTHIHRVSDAIQPSHPLSASSPPAPNPSQHQSLFQWDNSSQEVAKELEFQL